MSIDMSETLETASPEVGDELDTAFDDVEAVSADAIDPKTAPEPEDDFAPEPEETTESAAPVRDEKGRFATKSASESVAAETSVAAEAPAEEAAPSESGDEEFVPFKYRATGQTHEFEGAMLAKDGTLVIPSEQVSTIRQKLAAAAQFEAETYPRVQRLEQENQQLRQQRTAKDAQADAVLQQFNSFAQQYQQNPEAALTGIIQMLDRLPQEMLKAERDHYKTLAGKPAPVAVSPYADSPMPGTPPAREVAQAGVTDTFEAMRLELSSTPKYRGQISEADWQQVAKQVAQMAPAYLRQATPDEAQQYGLQPGEYALDTDMLMADVETRLAPLLAKAEAAAKAKAATEAAKFNKGAIQSAKGKPQSAGKPAAAAPAPTQKDAREAARERQEAARAFKRKFLSGGLLDEDDE